MLGLVPRRQWCNGLCAVSKIGKCVRVCMCVCVCVCCMRVGASACVCEKEEGYSYTALAAGHTHQKAFFLLVRCGYFHGNVCMNDMLPACSSMMIHSMEVATHLFS